MDLLAVLVVAVYSASPPASAVVINRVIQMQNPGNAHADLLKLIGAGGGLGPGGVGGLGGLGGLLGGAGGLGGAGAVQEPVDFEGNFTSNMKKFQRQVLRYTNRLRRLHGVHTLKQDPVLDRYAQAWALTLAQRDTMQHRASPLYGENLYMFWSSDLKAPIKGSMVVKSWYDEIKNYDFDHPGFRHGIGHFTQLVWKDSRRLGTGIARGRKGTLYVVCVYDPRGNIMTQFAQQVPRPLPTPSSDKAHAQGRR